MKSSNILFSTSRIGDGGRGSEGDRASGKREGSPGSGMSLKEVGGKEEEGGVTEWVEELKSRNREVKSYYEQLSVEATAWWNSVRSKASTSDNGEHEEISSEAIISSLTEEEMARLNYVPRVLVFTRGLDVRWRLSLSLYLDSLRGCTGFDEVEVVVSGLKRKEDWTYTLEELKSISTNAFRFGELALANWRFIHGMDSMGGFSDLKGPTGNTSIERLDDDLRSWFSDDTTIRGPSGEQEYLRDIIEGVRDFFLRHPGSFEPIEPKEFIRRPDFWATSGSSGANTSNLRLKVTVRGKRKVVRSKAA